MSVIDDLTKIGKAIFSLRKGLRKTPTGEEDAKNKRSLGIDQFISAKNPLIKSIAGSGLLAGVKAILAAIRGAYRVTAGQASPMFRFALHDWAIGLLTGAMADIQRVLQDEVLKKSSAGGEALALEGTVKTLIGEVKGMQGEQQEFMKDNKNLGKTLGADISKPA